MNSDNNKHDSRTDPDRPCYEGYKMLPLMQNSMSRLLRIVVESALGIVNGLIALTLYVAHANCVSIGFVRPGISEWAEIACLIGIVVVLLLMIFLRNSKQLFSRWILILIVTLWNQTCLIAVLVSLMPMSSHGITIGK